VRIVEMRVENLLGVCKRTIQSAANNGKVLGHLLVVNEVAFLLVVLADLFVQRRIANCCHSTDAHLGESSLRSSTKKLS
jgi:hypothetical protein